MIRREETIRLVPDLGGCDLGKIQQSLLNLAVICEQAAAEVEDVGDELAKARPDLDRP